MEQDKQQNNNPPLQQQQKRPWMPVTKEGKRALWCLVAVIVLGIIMPIAPRFFDNDVTRGLRGSSLMIVIVILTIVSLVFSIKAVFKLKDRAILSIGSFVLICLIGAFTMIFIISEIAFPH